ncbi:uncharacterized protein [Zea mays]|jgi:hypothetical protein|uniref:Uncharacterized protein n=1 Tax=Zea mays TaxID=4577 RepID=A0A1D6HC28_MAIZE|nr:uncharacterized protein LOC111589328 [Zea mays]AQK72254.1 hypothetical protein ZEAMMB73_Zm00001d017086 [Zea mays]|eukprot:XP_020393790.1 uncharacterized protein LOC103628736 [Zea mays]
MKGAAGSRSREPGDVDVELLKAVAQAWYAQSGNPRPSLRASGTGADDDVAGAGARGRAGAAPRRPSRFKLEAMAAAAASDAARARESSWDFAQSLLDTYELVAVARRLESVLDVAGHDAAAAAPQEGGARGAGTRRRESARSLRNLLLRSTSRRFQEPSS